jgi:hypothetical protein
MGQAVTFLSRADFVSPEEPGTTPRPEAQLLDRHRLDVVLREVGGHQFGEGQRSRGSPLAPQPLELSL